MQDTEKTEEFGTENESVKDVKKNPDEAIIIVKEKPNFKNHDFTEDEPKSKTEQAASQSEPNNKDEEDVSLKELAQKSIEARFEEVIGETKRANVSKKSA